VKGKGREFVTVPKGAAAAKEVNLIVWCKACQHQLVPDPAEMATRNGVETVLAQLARAAGAVVLKAGRIPKRQHGS
jgi:hypothetical protein